MSIYSRSQRKGTLYVGVTNDLTRRVWEHKQGLIAGFTQKYQVHQLMWFEEHTDIHIAIQREKQLKAWMRTWKLQLIESSNPEWTDLAESFLGL